MVFSFMQRLLVEFINNRDGFWLWFVCLWVSRAVCGVWLGQETHVALGRVFERTRGSIAPQIIGFAKKLCSNKASLWLKKLIPKVKGVFITFVHILWLISIGKLENAYSPNERKKKWIHICLVKCISKIFNAYVIRNLENIPYKELK